MKKIFLQPFFLLGLIIRLLLLAFVSPQPVTEWYMPFLNASINTFSMDPWATWAEHNSSFAVFPYGYIMWFFFLPLLSLCKLLSLPLIYGYDATIIAADFSLLLLIRKIIPGKDRLLLAVYWLSPIIIVASYWLGYNDLIPVLFLGISLYFIKQLKLMPAGLFFLAAISAKLSMILAFPFFLIYLLHNRALHQLLPQFIKGIIVGALVLLLPFFVFSHAGTHMLFSNPEMGKVFRLAINLGASTFIYIVPLIYFFMLYAAWRIRRLNFDLFNAMLGIAFLLVILMTPASPGWFIWTVPFLVAYQASSDRIAIVLTALFSALYVLSSLLLTASFSMDQKFISLTHTFMVATGIILALRIWRETVSQNDYFRLSRKPFVLGIAGDSGAGKDTFADAIKGLFGSHSVTTLSGDDYHLWDRQKPIWQVMTHLNPMANDLEGFANDLVALTDGKKIKSRHYNHQTGRMSRPLGISSNDIIIASGLHALYLPILRDCYNLSIYLDIHEKLRRHFKLQRDIKQRGHTLERVLASFEKREPDAARFIRPQASHADLVLSLQPIHPHMLESTHDKQPLRFKLIVRSCDGLNEMSLTRVLIGICGLHVDILTNSNSSQIELTIEGETTAQDIALAAHMICPRIFEFLDINPQWQDGILGLMQLVTLSHINQALARRFI